MLLLLIQRKVASKHLHQRKKTHQPRVNLVKVLLPLRKKQQKLSVSDWKQRKKKDVVLKNLKASLTGQVNSGEWAAQFGTSMWMMSSNAVSITNGSCQFSIGNLMLASMT